MNPKGLTARFWSVNRAAQLAKLQHQPLSSRSIHNSQQENNMQVKEAIHARRAIKHFDADHKMSAAEEKELLETTIQAPTSFNNQFQHPALAVRDSSRSGLASEYP
jgi:hypothetical protein